MAGRTERASETIVQNAAERDAWKRKRSIYLQKKTRDEGAEYVNVNGRSYMVPRGREVLVPEPVFYALWQSMRAEERAENFIREQKKETGPLAQL